jgi:hypothetical protein
MEVGEGVLLLRKCFVPLVNRCPISIIRYFHRRLQNSAGLSRAQEGRRGQLESQPPLALEGLMCRTPARLLFPLPPGPSRSHHDDHLRTRGEGLLNG